MGFFDRYDGDVVQNESALRRIMPILMPRRNDAVVYFEQTIEVDRCLEFLDRKPDISFFHVVLAAIVRAIGQRPMMNRFICGGRIYQRKDITLSFAVKKRLSDDAGMTVMKLHFTGKEVLQEVVDKVNVAIEKGRSKALTTSEKEMQLAKVLPRTLLSCMLYLQRLLDAWNLLPPSVSRNDPCYSSMFIANLGSVGLDAPFHHLYEYGTNPLFGTIGRIHDAPVVTPERQLKVARVVRLRYSFDERITDGLYCAKSLEIFAECVRKPELLELGV